MRSYANTSCVCRSPSIVGLPVLSSQCGVWQERSEDIKRIITELEDAPDGLVDIRQFEQAFGARLVGALPCPTLLVIGGVGGA